MEANLLHLNEHFRLPQLPGLIARKLAGAEQSILQEDDFTFHEREYFRLRETLERAMTTTALSEASSAKPALHDLLLRLRRGT